MIISCPECHTRYDVEDDRFLPDGRSVRCAACGESWFVPAPEPIEELVGSRRRAERDRREAENGGRARRAEGEQRQMHLDDDRESSSRREARAERGDGRDDPDRPRDERSETRIRDESPRRDDRDAGEEEDEKRGRGGFWSWARDRREPEDDHDRRDRSRLGDDDDEDEEAEHRGFWRGRPKSARDFSDDDEDDRLFRPGRDEDFDGPDREDRDHWGGADARAHRGGRKDYDERDDDRDLWDRGDNEEVEHRRQARIVDADFEDVDEDDFEPRERGFGRRLRAERRRATALARLDDLDPVAERVFNDEFFAALRVQPRELERAIRKARRRAEAREKNRMTPLRALGWSAWAGVIAATVFVAYTYRDDIVAMWPETAGAYAVVGVEAAPGGLKIESVSHRLAMSTSGPTIEISGSLKNNGEKSAPPPLMQAEALGPKGELLSRWTFKVESEEIAEGEIAEFTTRAPAPEGVVEVAISFAPKKGGKTGSKD